jgi:hypothetical protein
MNLNKLSRKWLATYLSCRLNITGKETKADLLHTYKLLGLPMEVSQQTVDRINQRIQNS